MYAGAVVLQRAALFRLIDIDHDGNLDVAFVTTPYYGTVKTYDPARFDFSTDAEVVERENITSELAPALEGADEGEAVVAETSNALYVIRKLSIADAYDEVEADEDQYISLLADMKGEEFNDYVLEQAQSVEGVELNQSAMNTVKLSSFVNDSTRNGASSASETESSASEESSSETSSAVESSESSASSEVSSESSAAEE